MGIRAASPGTFLDLKQHECQSLGIPTPGAATQLIHVGPGVSPVVVPDLPLPALPALPPVEGLPASAGQNGEFCLGIDLAIPNTPVVLAQAPCLGFSVPTLPLLPPSLADPIIDPIVLPGLPLPPLPVPIPALPIPIPLPVVLPF